MRCRHPLACVAIGLLCLGTSALSTAASEQTPLTAEIRNISGTPTLFVNGKPHSPFMCWGSAGARATVPIRAETQWQRFSTSFVPSENQANAALHFRMGGGQPNRVWVRSVSFTEDAEPTRNAVRSAAFPANWEKDWTLFVRTDTGAKATARPDDGGLRIDIADGGKDPMFVHLLQMGHQLVSGKRYTFSAELRAEKPQALELLVVEQGSDWTPYTRYVEGPVVQEHQLAAKAGVRIHSFETPMPWAGEGYEPNYAGVDECFDAMLKADPDGLLLPRFGTYPPPDWYKKNPSEVMLYDDGSRGQPSMPSEIWRRDVERSLRSYIKHVESRYGKHTIGYHPCGQHTGEWFYDRTWEGRMAGFEPAFVEGFRKFVRTRYGGNVEALRNAWRDKAAAFDTIAAPTKEERLQAGLGVFRDPRTERRLIDWNEYLQIAMVEPLEGFARVIKETTSRRKLAVIFYGYQFEIAALPHGSVASGHLAMGRLLQCPDVDVLCSPISYADRGLVGSTQFMVAVDSVRLHGKLWLNEDDARTYLSSKDDIFSRVDTLEHTRWVHMRNFGPLLTRRITCWWMDLPSIGWLNSPEIWDNLGKLKQLYDRDLGKPSQYAPQIAVVVDEKSQYHLAYSRTLDAPLLAILRSRYNRIGAPVGIYLLDDLIAGKVPESRLYIFPNAFTLTTQERTSLKTQLQRDGKVAVWMYGAGLIRDNAGTANMSDLLKMPIEQSTNAQSDKIRWTDADVPLLAGLKNSLLQLPADPTPALTIADRPEHCRVLARFVEGNKAAVAVREEPTYTTIYAGILTLPTDFLRNCARMAGVFLYVESDEVVQTDGRWLFISATTAGKKEIHLPRRATVRDAMTGQTIDTNIDRWQVDLQQGETRVYEME